MQRYYIDYFMKCESDYGDWVKADEAIRESDSNYAKILKYQDTLRNVSDERDAAQAEIASLQAEVERLRIIADGKWKCIERDEDVRIHNAALEEAARLAETSINDGGLAKSMAHFIEVEHWRVYKESCLKYAAAIRALKKKEPTYDPSI